MSGFYVIFLKELKRMFRPRNAVILSVLFVLCIGFILYGIGEYKHIKKMKIDFKTFEADKVGQYVTVTQYGTYGIRIFFHPAPVCIFFINTCGLPDIASFVDSGERLKTYNSLQGQNLFKLKVKKLGITDFSGVFLFLFSLAVLFAGYEAPRSRKYLKQLITLYSKPRVYLSLWLSRAVFLILVYLVLIGCIVLMSLLSGIPFSFHGPMLIFLLMGLLVLLFFLSLGFLLGMIKSPLPGVSLIFACWVMLVYLLPAAVNLFIAAKANNIISIYEMEMEKLRTIMAFEKKAIEKAGTFNYGKEVTEKEQEVITNYYNNEFQRINQMEDKLCVQMEETIRWCHLVSSIFPSTSYLAVSDEVSSMGSRSMVEFMRYTLDQKKEFFKYYMDKLYFSGGDNFGKIENFVKDEENIFYAKSRLPYYWLSGILLTLLFTLVTVYFGYLLFKKYFFLQPENWETGANNPGLKLAKGRVYPFHVKDNRFSQQLYNLLSGQNHAFQQAGFNEISIDSAAMVSRSYSCSFLYLCRIEELPGDITAGDLMGLFLSAGSSQTMPLALPGFTHKKLSRLTPAEKGDIYIKILAGIKREIYLIDNIGKHMSVLFVRRLKQQMDQLAAGGALVFYLLTDHLPVIENFSKNETAYKHDSWLGLIDNLPDDLEDIIKNKSKDKRNDIEEKK
jgi:hypothetical protein